MKHFELIVDSCECSVCSGGHILDITGKSESPEAGYDMVNKVIRDGSAKKRFMDMLVAQGELIV